MPPKIKKLKAALSRAGFYSISAKGSHSKWRHPALPGVSVVVSGNDGDDAKPYQIDQTQEALRKLGKEL
jgi:predicted RNA binding protein YcfA (HicA-like mRNA interferase family)